MEVTTDTNTVEIIDNMKTVDQAKQAIDSVKKASYFGRVQINATSIAFASHFIFYLRKLQKEDIQINVTVTPTNPSLCDLLRSLNIPCFKSQTLQIGGVS